MTYTNLLSQTLILGKAKKDFFLNFGGYIIFLANILKSLYTINLTYDKTLLYNCGTFVIGHCCKDMDQEQIVNKLENLKKVIKSLSEKRHTYPVGSKQRITLNLQFIQSNREANSLKNQLIELRDAEQTRLKHLLRNGFKE
ncbi:MAG: hypothetical protein EOO43_15090 [Flavobacterium sp.]|nr:MAG: hypothetical protein EOO43_15090 [Flavobacterium sp.]